ncbi:MAG: hypothetical protein ABIG66_03840 [Candidatus Kerfeldbacteria bacterium]
MNQKPFGQLLKDTFELYTGRFQFFLLATVILIFPVNLLMELLVPQKEFRAETLSDIGNMLFSSGPEVWYSLALSAVGYIVGIWLTIAVTKGTQQAAEGKEVKLGETLRGSLEHWLPLFLTTLVMTILLIPLFLLFFVPGLIFSIYWLFITPAVVIGGKKYFEALKYSKQLLQGHWWQAFGRIVVLLIVFVIIALVLSYASSTFTMVPVVGSVINTLMEVISVFATVFVAMYFLDLRKQLAASPKEPPERAMPAT